ncbi:MAG: hypothetical protein EOM76_07175 [Sphingobacteriia bacterium]|nr:hypothetical protein [Sphingobacteriia bacterium]
MIENFENITQEFGILGMLAEIEDEKSINAKLSAESVRKLIIGKAKTAKEETFNRTLENKIKASDNKISEEYD